MTVRFEALYLILSACTAAALFALERVGALRHQAVRLGRRTASNIGLFFAGNLFATLLIPVGVYAFALAQPPGLVSGSGLPLVVQWLLCFLLLDLWRYWEHRLFHRLPLLWRLHRVHHSDVDVDVTTSERHHPIDVLIGTALSMGVIAALGLPAFAVAGYLMIAMAVSLSSHANLCLP
jgi:sterol desaturase/sphingolipid hydroxylase (fatty acid hydroxylase superfamily)